MKLHQERFANRIMKKMKLMSVIILFVLLLATPAEAQKQEGQRAFSLSELNIRDPYILADPSTRTYYLYASQSTSGKDGKERGGVVTYTSKDLKQWTGPVSVFTVPENNWITGGVWAPEVHAYKGQYYLFATLNSDIEWKKSLPGQVKYTFRGTQIFHARSPKGPFLPFEMLPHTPMDWMALDGTLWVENGQPYMVFCHEWVQVGDGTMNVVKLAPDLSKPVSEPLTLFCGSAPEWSTGSEGAVKTYVTDGCFLHRSRSGKLLMIWSSFKQGQYTTGIAESVTGKVTGPWKQQREPLFSGNGGHGMLFKTFDGRLCLVLHAPNSPAGKERPHIYEIEDMGYTLRIKQSIIM